jgi:hypothetical protein
MRLERSRRSHTLRATILISGGGVLDLRINRNGLGALEHTGELRARDIRVRSDSVVGDALQKAAQRATPSPPEQHAAWPAQLTLESIRASFSIGHGQLVIHDAVLNAQLVSAALRGKVDLGSQTINASGTYLPWVAMPTLLTGPFGERLFGGRFAIHGPLAKPEMVVNPMWLISPGFFRKILELQAREETNQ